MTLSKKKVQDFFDFQLQKMMILLKKDSTYHTSCIKLPSRTSLKKNKYLPVRAKKNEGFDPYMFL
jgi:hypothetical protein